MNVQMPETQYVKSNGYHIAYQVLGSGKFDLVVIPGFGSNLEVAWEQPRYQRWFQRVSSYCRLILIDKRGTGLSDRVPAGALPTLEDRMQDVLAVLDAAGSERTAFCGISEGGAMSALFAATYPERTIALILSASWSRAFQGPDYPWGFDPSTFQQFIDSLQNNWGRVTAVPSSAPSLANDREFVEWWAKYQRMSASPGEVAGLVRMAFEGDVRHVLPAISCPTLVLHRTNDPFVQIEHGRYMAEHIPGAQIVECPGIDHLHYVGETEEYDRAFEVFLTGQRAAPTSERLLTTLLFTDIVGSTNLAANLGDDEWYNRLEEHNTITRKVLKEYSGHEVSTTGDGFLARFDAPGKAVRCAQHLHQAVSRLDLEIRAGLHTGEVQLSEGDLSGIAVHIAARVAETATAGETRVTSTIRDLVVGSGLEFSDHGTHPFKGVPGEWTVLSVKNS